MSSDDILHWDPVEKVFEGRLSRVIRQVCWQGRNESRCLSLQRNILSFGASYFYRDWDPDLIGVWFLHRRRGRFVLIVQQSREGTEERTLVYPY